MPYGYKLAKCGSREGIFYPFMYNKSRQKHCNWSNGVIRAACFELPGKEEIIPSMLQQLENV